MEFTNDELRLVRGALEDFIEHADTGIPKSDVERAKALVAHMAAVRIAPPMHTKVRAFRAAYERLCALHGYRIDHGIVTQA